MNYIPNTDEDRKKMFSSIGISSIEELFDDIPLSAREKQTVVLPKPMPEIELRGHMREQSEKNSNVRGKISFLGAGAYDHYIPSVVKAIVSRSEFYTAYTPYQPEISQGLLQAIYEYQSMICGLTGMGAANASLYDGATAIAEAAFLAVNHTKRKEIIISKTVNPLYRRVLETYCDGADLKVNVIDFENGTTNIEKLKNAVNDRTACVIVQHPNFFGCLEDVFETEKITHKSGALLAVSVDPISLGVLKPPSEYGADIVTGEGQCMGSPLNFGGPYLGVFAVKKELIRLLPGRIVGMTEDHDGKRGFVLTLQTREQHIRREKATSNICSNEALAALAAAVYLAAMGKKGIKLAGRICFERAGLAKKRIASLPGFSLCHSGHTFKEFCVKYPRSAAEVNYLLAGRSITGGLDLGKYYPEMKNSSLLCCTEKTSEKDIEKLVLALKDV
ncbi:MAG: aminomethyl-transferring glycine dehydrogenase subunit GcvPA [Candidatus Saganbacteria bacterium]|nr:aminomethyl-transferring glycine dehydrogenase subunit GcvPA [Candidatus Saganbacteria bacterium]